MILSELNLHYSYLLISLTATYYYIYNIIPFILFYVIFTSCLFDLYFIKKPYDIIFHHICSLGYIYYILTNPISTNDNIRSLFINTSLSFEISTNFLLMNNILKIYKHQSIINHINNILFICTFIYYRIYQYGNIVIFNKVTNDVVLYNSNNNFDIMIIYFSLYGFYFLNLYWGSIILSKVYPKIIKFFFRMDEICF